MPRNIHRIATASLLMLGAGCALVNDNLRKVEDDEFYRSAQMSRGRLGYVVTKHQIKTVVNLRGANPDEEWYQNEVAVCEERGVAHHDLKWTMRRIPEPESLQQLVDFFQSAEKPILVHCQAGIHRAGTASAAYKLYKGASPRAARRQFGIYFHDAPIGELVDLYEKANKPFAEWVRTDYVQVYEDYVREQNAE
ncbi:MAG: dual specificity protein phosphatase family protein [Candidatus Hydrogenedentes bacterium]|nr:dual specificity protein phosphatase family protein [Candidatus Hydrogenedentota bacterium]